MKINKKYKYWLFNFDKSNKENTCPDENNRKCIAAIWDDEWRGIELLDKSDVELKDYLTQVIDDYNVYTGEKINSNLIELAIAEMKKIKEEQNLV
ncbi:hypothetical protein [Paenibacillus radicis (ex Gao et al. 2016)]|uniref:Uncharacterized protein n=1 Tax=Paenibacillus radicis (ex Gao et al. 2016) TaxID=1737354 RepID=A0A917HHL7_9BACL|nr:hypothetical protein [Paenibacillus radicis (ex Gao et al. 2016)]GGG79996.1 hypothetical protein GCM10010918_41390 [Paenibacillus radicis (ex Gao et al. 2016)]